MKRLKGKVALTLVVTMMGTTVSPNTIGVVQAADNGGKEMRMHFTELSGRHSVLERPLSEVNGRLFFS